MAKEAAKAKPAPAPPKSKNGAKEGQKQPPPPAVVVAKPKTGVAARLDQALQTYPRSQHRSSDLIPLTHDFEVMRKKLKETIRAAKSYHTVLLEADRAHLDLVAQLSAVSEKSPIEQYIGGTSKDSLSSIAKETSQQMKAFNENYTLKIVDYCTEWENIVSTRVETGMEENRKKNARLDHYQTKVEGLRKKTNKMIDQKREKDEKKAASADDSKKPASPTPPVPKRVADKLARNEYKLQQAWNEHERSAASLCNLLEEVTSQGYHDLFPLVLNLVEWKINRALTEYDSVKGLATVQEKISKTVASEVTKRQEHFQTLQKQVVASHEEAEEEEEKGDWSSSSSTEGSTETPRTNNNA